LLAGAAVLALSLASAGSEGPTWSFYISTRTLPAGATITRADLGEVKGNLGGQAGRLARSGAWDPVGQTLAVAVGAGELLEPSMLVPDPGRSSSRPVSVVVQSFSLSGLAPGDAVDVLADQSTQSPGSTTASILLRGATLLAVEPASSSLVGSTSGSVVTLGVSNLAEVQVLVGADAAGPLVLVAAAPSDGRGLGGGPEATSYQTSAGGAG